MSLQIVSVAEHFGAFEAQKLRIFDLLEVLRIVLINHELNVYSLL